MKQSVPKRADVVVIGGGSAGAGAALACARRGLDVVLLERRALTEAGPTWVNTVADWQFDAANIARPVGAERVGGGGSSYLIAGRGPTRIRVPLDELIEVDMRHLVARLHRLAKEAGANLVGPVRVESVEGGLVQTDLGAIQSDWIVDATGLAGKIGPERPHIDPRHLCVAAQEVREITDWDAARAFFAHHDATPQDTLSFTAVAGGYSLESVRTHGHHLALLMGSIPADDVPSGRAMLEDFVDRHSWVGAKVFGGAAAIPLRRPFDQLAVGRLARVGDAACQVFPAHGSGVGPGLVAGRFLANSLAAGRGAQGYAVDWQRRWGGHHAAHDLFRRFSQKQDASELARMMELGLLDGPTAAAGVAQRRPRVALGALPNKIVGLAKEPALARRIGVLVAKMVAVTALYARYPRDPKRLPAWSRRVARLFGDAPDHC